MNKNQLPFEISYMADGTPVIFLHDGQNRMLELILYQSDKDNIGVSFVDRDGITDWHISRKNLYDLLEREFKENPDD